MKKFTLFWLTGKSEVIVGIDIANACNRNGIGRGALAALDFYAEGDIRNDYAWNASIKSWDVIAPLPTQILAENENDDLPQCFDPEEVFV